MGPVVHGCLLVIYFICSVVLSLGLVPYFQNSLSICCLGGLLFLWPLKVGMACLLPLNYPIDFYILPFQGLSLQQNNLSNPISWRC